MRYNVFTTDKLPPSWAHGNLVLIPKAEHPIMPTQFRPLSVCSVFYRLLMKVIANRVKPLLANLISTTQMTFLKERCIQESVLLMNEVLFIPLNRLQR
jgi:Reverse transcriptase (RNA-dependent DNA polymerase)